MESAGKTCFEMVRRVAANTPEAPALIYFDDVTSYGQLHVECNALAAFWEEAGLVAGDRIILCLQNVPAFVIAFAAASRLGAIVVPVNPMYREGEIAKILSDSTPRAILCHPDYCSGVLSNVDYEVDILMTASPVDRQERNDPRLFSDIRQDLCGAGISLEPILAQYRGREPSPRLVSPDDLACLVYTSGTTGTPKGAMISHRNLNAGGQVYARQAGLTEKSRILGLAPLFHVTGLSGHIAASLICGGSLILTYRFSADVVLDTIREEQPSFTVAAITAFTALMESSQADPCSFASFTSVFCGGAPIAPAKYQRAQSFGLTLCNAYGLTETTAPVVVSPRGETIPVDHASGALAVGKPVPGTEIDIVDNGKPMSPGEIGELVVRGPSVTRGYWQNEAETAAAFRPEGFFTGDVGFRDEQGWIYLVDRKKDMIVASGFKVWPREVEDILCSHPLVREAAVVGMPDDYRGESVKAVISLRHGSDIETSELVAYCRSRLAAYKCPKLIEIVEEVPKSITGKILRREVR